MEYTAGQEQAAAVVALVAETYGLSVEQFHAPGRDPLMVEARRVAMVLLAERGMGATHIGRMVGRDHSTVLHHVALIRERPTSEEREMLADLRGQIKRKGMA